MMVVMPLILKYWQKAYNNNFHRDIIFCNKPEMSQIRSRVLSGKFGRPLGNVFDIEGRCYTIAIINKGVVTFLTSWESGKGLWTLPWWKSSSQLHTAWWELHMDYWLGEVEMWARGIIINMSPAQIRTSWVSLPCMRSVVMLPKKIYRQCWQWGVHYGNIFFQECRLSFKPNLSKFRGWQKQKSMAYHGYDLHVVASGQDKRRLQ